MPGERNAPPTPPASWGQRATSHGGPAAPHAGGNAFSFYDEQKTGHLVGRLTKDFEEIGEVAHHCPEDLFIAVMTLIGAFVLMFVVSPPLALITLVVVPFTGWLTARFGGRMTRNWRAITMPTAPPSWRRTATWPPLTP